MRTSVGRILTTTFSTGSFKLARRQLKMLRRRLDKPHPGAAASLMEGFDELLTVKALNLDKLLERSPRPLPRGHGSLRPIFGRRV